MKKKVFAVLLSFVLAITGCVVPVFTENDVNNAISAAESNEWILAWSDEFDGTSLNRNNWNVEVNGYGGWNNELQYYCDSPENIQVSDGTLKLIAQKKQYQGKDYTSARLNTQNKVVVNHGRIEAKIKLPKFKGAFPAFWMMGANGLQWPKCGEIDIMEAVNDESIIYGTAHWACDYTNNEEGYDSKGSSTYAAGLRVDITQWHTYGIEWTKDKILWYIDDNFYHSVDITSEKQMEELAIPSYILLNFAVGGDWPGFNIDNTAFPATMEVDYVRAYEKNPDFVEKPTITVREDAIEKHNGVWEYNLGSWANVTGSVTSTQNLKDGFVANLTTIGNDMWGGSASLKNLQYIPGSNYTLTSTITSNIDKNIFVKVEGDDNAEIAADYIKLKAGVPYTYTKTFFVPNNYTGRMDLYYFFSGSMNGESLSENTSANITVRDVSMYTTTTMEEPSKEQETTTPEPTEPPTEPPTTKTFDAFNIIEAEDFSSNQGGIIDTNNNVSGGHNIGGVSNGVLTVYENVNFSESAGAINICYSSPTGIAQGNAEIYVDNINNKVGTVVLTNNGNAWETYSNITANLDTEINVGKHTIYIKYVTTGNKNYVANVDYFKFIKSSEIVTEPPINTIEGGIEINGYQISSIVGGMRTVYSVDSKINDKDVVSSGLIYSLSDYVNDSDLYVGSQSYYVRSFESTNLGKIEGYCFSESDLATSYAMTMRFASNNPLEYTDKWKIRAYAKLSDDTYVYSDIYSYTFYEIADILYQTRQMSTKDRHDYLYTNILSIVNKEYPVIDYYWNDGLIGIK